MAANLPRVLFLNWGGTWMMTPQERKENGKTEVVLVPEDLPDDYDLLEDFPELAEICEVSFKTLGNLDSTNIAHGTWSTTAYRVAAEREHYDGFVVLHGTDTMEYTASGLSFCLAGFGKPVVLTGAQIAKCMPGSDARNNIVNAAKVAALREGEEQFAGARPALDEVVMVFGSRIIRGTRARKYSEANLEAFDTVNAPLVGEIQQSPRLFSSALHPWRGRKWPTSRDDWPFGFDSNVALIQLFPGIRPDFVLSAGRQSSGLVVGAFGAGNIPSSTEDFENPLGIEAAVAELVDSGVPVVVTTQCVVGRAELPKYEGGMAAREAGTITANDMSMACAFVKLSWLLGNDIRFWPREARRVRRNGRSQREAIRKALLSDIAGEVLPNKLLFGTFGP